MADGGEGTVEAVLHCTAGEKAVFTVTGPLGEPVQAFYGRLSGNRAIMEMAEASGLMLVPKEKRNPLLTSTMGTGEMIARAMEDGAAKFSWVSAAQHLRRRHGRHGSAGVPFSG